VLLRATQHRPPRNRVWFCPQPTITVHKAAAVFTKGAVTFHWLPAGTPGVSTCTLRGAHEPASRTPCDAAQLGNKGDTGTAGTNLVRIPCSQARSMEGRRTHLGYSEYGIRPRPRTTSPPPPPYGRPGTGPSPPPTTALRAEGEGEGASQLPRPEPTPPTGTARPHHESTTLGRGRTWQFFCS